MNTSWKVALVTALGAGSVVSGFAGPEPITDYSKGKEPIVETKPVEECNWYISLGGGVDFDYGTTDFNRSHFIPAEFGAPAALEVVSHDFDDAYGTFYHIQGEVGYALGQHVEIFGTFTYSAAGGQTTSGSRLVSIAGDLRLENQWGDYTSYGGQVGVRYFFLSRHAWVRPYISLSGGATRVESIDFTTRAANDFGPISRGDVLFDGKFYGNSVVGTGSVLAGIEVPITRCFAVGADAGMRYDSKLAQDDGDLDKSRFPNFNVNFPNLNKINDNAGDRLYCPVTLYAKIRF